MRHKKIAGTTHPQCSLTYWITVKNHQFQPKLYKIDHFWLKLANFSCVYQKKVVPLQRILKLYSMEAVVYNTAEEKRSARNRLIVIKTAIEEQMRQRMTKMEW